MKQTDEMTEIVERAKSVSSKQSRYKDDTEFFMSLMRWTEQFEAMPEYQANSRTLDKWLTRYWMQEPFMAGVVYQAVAMVKNRGWLLTGGRNQVLRFTTILHDAEAGKGWRHYISKAATSFYTTNMGSITEIGRAGRNGPVRGLFHVDPTKCVLTPNQEYPLRYYPPRAKMQNWRADDFFRVESMPVIEDEFNGLGFCAVHRAIEITRIMLSLTRHSQEKLGARAPKGILLLQNVPERKWIEALESNEADLDSKARQAYAGVMVLATIGPNAPDGKLLELSRLPDGFDQQSFINLMMYAYALCFGFDPSEFWPVQFGALGRGTEMEVQHEKATGKGGLDFVLSYQEMLQNMLPYGLLFEFEQRDQAADTARAQYYKVWADIAKAFTDTGQAGEQVLSRDEIRSMLVDNQIIPQEWTETEEDAQATDTENNRLLKARLRDKIDVRTAALRFPQEPIVVCRWPAMTEMVLWETGADMLHRSSYPTATVKRAGGGTVLFEDESTGLTITEQDVDMALKEAKRRVGSEFFEVLTASRMTEAEEAAEDIHEFAEVESV